MQQRSMRSLAQGRSGHLTAMLFRIIALEVGAYAFRVLLQVGLLSMHVNDVVRSDSEK